MFYRRSSTAPFEKGVRKEEKEEKTVKHWNKEGRRGGEERERGVRRVVGAGVEQKTGINHNYNQRARKLHRVRPLWPRDSWLPASHENLSPNFGFLQDRCLSLLCIHRFFRDFSRVSSKDSARLALPYSTQQRKLRRKERRRKILIPRWTRWNIYFPRLRLCS